MMLSEKARAARNQYVREWRANHKDRVRETNRKYWERRAAKQAAEKGGVADASEDANDY